MSSHDQNYYTKGLDSYQVIADVLNVLKDDARCRRTRPSSSGVLEIWGVRGEVKMNDNWSVVVRHEKC